MEECSPWQSYWPHSIWHILCVDTNGTWNDHWMICLFQDFLTSEKIISSHIKITIYNDKKEEINMLSEVIIFIYSHCDTYTKLLKSGHLWPKIYPLCVQRDWLCNTHILVQGKRSFVFHFASVFTSSAHQRLCTVSFFFPLTLLPWMILCDVIRVAERFIKHIISFCLLLVRILNKLLSAPKSELCFICVRGCSWGININSKSSIETLILYIFPQLSLLKLIVVGLR